jgi:ring-1,2-phenylacetyl-CoA epoxidase subunit PaaE
MNQPRQFTLNVKEIIKETADAITIKLENIVPVLSYSSGQFITLVLHLGGKEVRRSYSISSSPYTDNDISICVKAIPDGQVSNHLKNNLKVGETLDVLEPMGNFLVNPKSDKQRHVFLFGAGSGITPLISIAKTILSSEPKSKVSLVYGNRTFDDIIYKHEIEKLEAENNSRFTVVNVISRPNATWVGYTGRINRALAVNVIEKLAAVTRKECEYYLCGPSGMTDEVLVALDLLGVPKINIHKESFHAPLHTPVATTAMASSASKVKVIDGKKTYQFDVEANETILEKALKLGHNLPYSCQAGMCTACMGKCTTGKVQMDNPDGLTDNEVKKGFVLTCIGYPAAPEIIIEL